MKVQYGSIVVDARGKVGDVVASKNHAGNFLRELVIPTDIPSSFKTTARTQFSDISQRWRELSQAERDLWNRQAMEFSILSTFATVRKPSGFHLFMSCNINRLYAGLGYLNQAPQKVFIAPPPVVGAVAYGDDGYFEIECSYQVPIGSYWFLYVSPPVSQGISNYHQTFYFMSPYSDGDGPYFAPTTQFFNRFGRNVTTGEKLFFKFIAVDASTGLASLPQFISCIAQ